MSTSEEQVPFNGWAQIIVVLLLTTGASAIWLQPLLSERPRPSGMGTVSEGVQHVSARLWQDPFGAVKKAVDKTNSERTLQRTECLAQGARANERGELFLPDKTPCIPVLKRTLGWLSRVIQERQEGQEKVLLIYALVSGSNGVGRDEARRRQRYALLAALNQEGYKPEDPEHIGYSEDTVLHASLILPFEWFNHITGSRRAIVLWVNEETLSLQLSSEKEEGKDRDKAHRNQGHGPLARLANLHARINGEPAKTQVSGRQKSDRLLYPIILGPMSSTYLQKAQGELCRADEISAALAILKDIPWYSPLATLPEREFFHTPCPRGASGSKKPLSQWLPNFIRATPTDDLQLSAMISEMERRGVKPGSTVVLVGQWDTAYTLSRKISSTEPCPSGQRRNSDIS